MPRSHPPTLLTLTNRTLTDPRSPLLKSNDVVLVAVSGGPDSMALLHVLAKLRPKIGYVLHAHGIDHGLRASAASELDLAEQFAHSLDVPFDRTNVAVEKGGNLQARARTARFDALRAKASRVGASSIATAHHAQDRAETVLLRLLRGSGAVGLGVLPPRSEDLIRPFINASRQAIDAHIERHQVPHAIDPSNRDPRYLRSRVRFELLPLLQSMSPTVIDHLCAIADDALEARKEGQFAHMCSLPRATRKALEALGPTSSRHAKVVLPGGLVASYDHEQVAIVFSHEGDRTRSSTRND